MPDNLPKPKHDHATLEFPSGFLWGAATSAYQVEGGNTQSDWWHWRGIPLSGEACDHYHRYEEDFDLAKKLHHNAHRLSLEWARIEPEEGKFNQAEIEHYQNVLEALKKRNIAVMLTLHHFSSPHWFTQKGGWASLKAPYYFARFIKKIVPQFKDYVDFWITINEPGVYTWAAYLIGKWPPQQKSKIKAIKATWNLAQAHRQAYHIIHQIIPHAKVGVAHNVASFSTQQSHSILQHILVWFYDLAYNHLFYFLTGQKTHDFLGINYYFHQRIGSHNGSKFPKLLDASLTKKDVSDMGWEIHPEGIFDVLKDFSDYKLPIYITENGLASTNDDRRCRFLISYLKEVYHAITSGVDVRGYFHWAFMDNFEWTDGFIPRFGLVEVDYRTQKRTPRPSAYIYGEIIKNNGIAHYLMRFIGHTVNAKEVLP